MASKKAQRGATSERSSTRRQPVPKRRRRIVNYPRYGRTGVLRWIPSWKLILGGIATFCLMVVGGFAAAVAFTTIPQANDIARAEKTIVYWNDGKTELGRLGESNRISVPLAAVPANVRNAVLAAEDREFYDHGGFDPIAIARAAWNQLNGGATQGGSTITQQYAKNAFLSQEQTIPRKAKELVLSVKLETEASKDEILENYLNTIYLGRGAYGMQTASQSYFGKPVAKLTLSESAALAAIIRAPGGYDPETHKDKLRDRFEYVLAGMQEKGWITSAQHANAKLPTFVKYKVAKTSLAGTNGYLLESVQREMLRRGYSEDELNLGGFRITTSFDKQAQESAVEAVENSGPGEERGLRVGLTSVRPQTGEVVAMYGGKDYAKNQLSNADQAIALAGSTFKPFALAVATEEGIGLDQRYDGSSPRTIRGYTIHNEGNESFGEVSLLTGIEKSINTVFYDLGIEVGPERVRAAAIRAGLPKATVGLVADPQTVLGTAAPTTLDMASAYGTFANRGERVAPTTIKEIKRNNGGVEYTLNPEATRVFSNDVADTVNYALQKVVTSGTGYAASGLGRPAAGKTGTTDNNKSAWFVGYTPQLSTAVMMAKQDSKGNSITLYGTGGGGSVYGGSYPASMWTSFMSGALDGEDVEDFTDPEEVYGGEDYSSYNNYNYRPSEKPSPSASGSAKPSGSSTGAASGNASGSASGGSTPSAGGGASASSSSGATRPSSGSASGGSTAATGGSRPSSSRTSSPPAAR